MARYTDESKDRVREAIDFVELVAARTGGELRRSGPRSYMGLCPFHDERTPSFSVEPVAKLFHCFGCGESGDVFDFVMKTENVDFGGALELLADRIMQPDYDVMETSSDQHVLSNREGSEGGYGAAGGGCGCN